MHTPQDHPDFIGWHCQTGDRADIEHEDTIGFHHNREDIWPHILANLPEHLKQPLLQAVVDTIQVTYGEDAATDIVWGLSVNNLRRLINGEIKPYSAVARIINEDFSHVVPLLPAWFEETGLKWIWTTLDAPVWGGRDHVCYAAFLPEEAILTRVWDSAATDWSDEAYVYIYDSNVAIPQVIPTNREAHTIWGNPPRRSR